MASFIDCIMDKVKSGEITTGDYRDILADYETLFDKYSSSMSAEAASAKASADLAASLESRNTFKANKIRQALVNAKLVDRMNKRKEVPYIAAKDQLEIAKRAGDGIVRRSSQLLNDAYKKLSGKEFLLSRDVRQMDDAVLIMSGSKQAFGPEAKAVAGAMREVMDFLHQTYDSLGGRIGYIKNYFPTVHEPTVVRRMGEDQWLNLVMKHADMDNLPVNRATGSAMSPEEYEQALRNIYKEISKDGRVDFEYGLSDDAKFKHQQKFYERRDQSRFIKWKSAEDYAAYMKEMGYEGDRLFTVFERYVKNMSRDIGVMSYLGNDPYSAKQTILNWYKSTGEGKLKADKVSEIEDQFDVLMGLGGDRNAPGYYGAQTALTFFRAQLTGGSALLALFDGPMLMFANMTSGLSSTRAIKSYMAGVISSAKAGSIKIPGTDARISPLGWLPQSRSLADVYRIEGFKHMEIMGQLVAEERMTGFVGGGANLMRKYADVHNTFSGNNLMTRGSVLAAASNIYTGIADTLKTPFNKLPEAWKRHLETFGFTEQDWSLLSLHKTAGYALDGGKVKVLNLPGLMKSGEQNPVYMNLIKKFEKEYLATGAVKPGKNETPQSLAHAFATKEIERLVVKIDAMAEFHSHVTINNPSLATKTWTTANLPAGQMKRAFQEAKTMLLSWPITATYNMLGRTMEQIKMNGPIKGLYAPAMFAVASYLVYDKAVEPMYEASFGRTQAPDSPKKAFKSLHRSGAFGLIGDVLFDDYSNVFATPTDPLVGPVFGAIGDAIKAGGKGFGKILEGDFRDVDYEELTSWLRARSLKGASRFVPFSQMWYTRLLFQRYLFDPLFEISDPDYYKKVKAAERAMEKSGQEFWWAPGDKPDYSKIFSEPTLDMR